MADRPFDLDRAALLDTTVVVPGAAARELAELLEDGVLSRPDDRRGVSRDVRDVAQLLRKAAQRVEALASLRSETAVSFAPAPGEIVASSQGQETRDGLTTEEASVILRRHVRRVQQWVSEGLLSNLADGRPFLLDRGEVEALAEQLRQRERERRAS